MDTNNVDRVTPNALPSLLTLYLKRTSPDFWNTPQCKSYIESLEQVFLDESGVSLKSVLESSDSCNIQDIFDKIMLELNPKLTNDINKYPALINVYSFLIKDITDFEIKVNPVNIFPISLILIDDVQNANKIKGLNNCYALMQCLNEEHFKSGNYYEVLYASLKKTMPVKDVEVTKLALQCLLDFIKIVPSGAKKIIADEVFERMLEQLHIESDLHRKAACVRFLKEAIKVHEVNCANRTLMMMVLLEHIHICCNDPEADILLMDVLECLQVWITHCWSVWQLSSDHKVLSALIKLLYISRKEPIATVIQDIIVSLIGLCTKDEQKTIYENLRKSEIKSPDFIAKLDEIKTEILKLCI